MIFLLMSLARINWHNGIETGQWECHIPSLSKFEIQILTLNLSSKIECMCLGGCRSFPEAYCVDGTQCISSTLCVFPVSHLCLKRVSHASALTVAHGVPTLQAELSSCLIDPNELAVLCTPLSSQVLVNFSAAQEKIPPFPLEQQENARHLCGYHFVFYHRSSSKPPKGRGRLIGCLPTALPC